MITKRVGDMYISFRNARDYLLEKHNAELRYVERGQLEEWWAAEFGGAVSDKVDPTIDVDSEADYTMFLLRFA